MSMSITVANHKAPSTKYIRGNEIRELKVDGELEPEIRDAFQKNAKAVTWREVPMLEPKNLKPLTESETFQRIQTAGQEWEPVELDLGAGARSYDAWTDKAGNVRLVDSEDLDFQFSPQVITVSKHGNRVHLSTFVQDGGDSLVQDIRMNLTGSGNFYCSEESLGVNSRSMMMNHHSTGNVGEFPLGHRTL